ncbi:MAG: hypothetical protein AB1410_03755 [Acidobacteriota bacterium]
MIKYFAVEESPPFPVLNLIQEWRGSSIIENAFEIQRTSYLTQI